MKMLAVVLTGCAIAFATPSVDTLASVEKPEDAAARAVESYHTALATGDSAAAVALLASDVVVLESGHFETREEYLSHHLGADMAFSASVTTERGDSRIVAEGDVAWVTTMIRTTGQYKDRPINHISAELIVLTRAGRDWKIRAIHWSSRPAQ